MYSGSYKNPVSSRIIFQITGRCTPKDNEPPRSRKSVVLEAELLAF
jgi:hypothetical protein